MIFFGQLNTLEGLFPQKNFFIEELTLREPGSPLKTTLSLPVVEVSNQVTVKKTP